MPKPPHYKETYPEELFLLMQKGKKGAQLHSHFNISKKTFYNWITKHPDFKEAYEKGWESCETYWERIGEQMIEEKDERGHKIWLAFMNRHFGWGKNLNESQSGTHININNLTVFQQQSKEELIEYIQKQLSELHVIEGELISEPIGSDMSPLENE